MIHTPLSAFRAATSACTPTELWVRVGAQTIQISVAGPHLAQRLLDPMRHIEVAPSRSAADISIHAWSVEETGIAPPSGFASAWSEPSRSIIASSFPSADQLARSDIARPFQRELVMLLAGRGLPTVHGGLVASAGDDPGLLLIGPNGSGKSTTCLAAVQAGFGLVGEDCLAIEASETGFRGHSLYCSVNLTHHSRQMFEKLSGSLHIPFGASPEAKAVLLLPPTGDVSPMNRSQRIGAVVFPEIAGGAERSCVVPISKAEAHRRLMPGLRLMRYFEPEVRRQHYARLVGLIGRLPCYRIDLGSSLRDIPPRLRELAMSLQ